MIDKLNISATFTAGSSLQPSSLYTVSPKNGTIITSAITLTAANKLS